MGTEVNFHVSQFKRVRAVCPRALLGGSVAVLNPTNSYRQESTGGKCKFSAYR